MKMHALLLIPAAILVANGRFGYAAETSPWPPPGASRARWELQIVNNELLRGDSAIPATLQNVIDYLVELYPANVVLAPSLGKVQIGNLKLARFEWATALQALRIASGNQFVWTSRGSGPGIDPVTGVPIPPQEKPELYVLEPDLTGTTAASGKVVEVFNMGGYLEGRDAKETSDVLNEVRSMLADSLAQIRAGAEFGDFGSAPNIRFHDRANLLVVVGTPEQLDVARKIILALPGTMPSQASTGWRYGGGGMDPEFMTRYGLRPGQSLRIPENVAKQPEYERGAARPATAMPGSPGSSGVATPHPRR